jgi:SAM-dependent methyltransferase
MSSEFDRAPESCIVCGGSKKDLLIEKAPWKVYRCAHCELGFLDPRPSQRDLEKLYEREYFLDNHDKGLPPGSRDFEKRVKSEDHRLKFFRSIKPSGRLLDIGCRYGYFLFACEKNGYDAKGLDISPWAIQYAEKKLGLSAIRAEIDEVNFPSGSFEIITMWHILEHVRNPDLTLRKVGDWMREDGIVIIDVPNYKGTDAQATWVEWGGWSLPYHLWHFTYGSLKGLLEKHGFKVIRYKDYHSEVVKKKLSAFPILKPLARLIAKRYSGTSVAVIAIRKETSFS